MDGVRIRGGGVAALCCEHLLRRAGIRVLVQSTDRPRIPAILLSASAQQLIGDVFSRQELFRNFPPVTRRVVIWPHGAEPVRLPHSAVVVSEEELLQTLHGAAQTNPLGSSEPALVPDGALWTIECAGVPDAPAVRFGTRVAEACSIKMKRTSDPAACWMEALENGWLFLVSGGDGTGWLLSVGGAA